MPHDLFYVARLLFGWAADAFLLHPQGDVGRAVFDRDVSGFGGAEEHHRGAVDEGYILEIKRSRSQRGRFFCEQPLDFREIFGRQLAT